MARNAAQFNEHISLHEAMARYGLSRRDRDRVYRILARHRRATRPYWRGAKWPVRGIEAALAEIRAHDEEAQQRRRPAPRPRLPKPQAQATMPCPVCGKPIPRIWILDRCHECLKEAA